MKEIKLDMNDSSSSNDIEKPSDNNNTHEDEIATVKKVPEKIIEKIPGATLLQKLTTVLFIFICVLICIFSIKTMHHFQKMNDYKLPENAVVDSSQSGGNNADNKADDTENVEYVNQVTYSPSDAAKQEMADSDNGKDWMAYPFTCPYTWSFKSDYEYASAKIECIWICTNNDTGELLAFRVADYDASSNEFSNASIYTTKIGGTYIEAN